MLNLKRLLASFVLAGSFLSVSGISFGANGNGKCCVNTPASPNYRKCVVVPASSLYPNTPFRAKDYNCNLCGISCCPAGIKWCPSNVWTPLEESEDLEELEEF